MDDKNSNSNSNHNCEDYVWNLENKTQPAHLGNNTVLHLKCSRQLGLYSIDFNKVGVGDDHVIHIQQYAEVLTKLVSARCHGLYKSAP